MIWKTRGCWNSCLNAKLAVNFLMYETLLTGHNSGIPYTPYSFRVRIRVRVRVRVCVQGITEIHWLQLLYQQAVTSKWKSGKCYNMHEYLESLNRCVCSINYMRWWRCGIGVGGALKFAVYTCMTTEMKRFFFDNGQKLQDESRY